MLIKLKKILQGGDQVCQSNPSYRGGEEDEIYRA